MSTLPAILAAILVALRADLGDFDLSETADQVQEGTHDAPPVGTRPFASLPPAELVASEGRARNVYYVDTYRQRVRLWAPTTQSTAPSRASTSRQLAMEAGTRLEKARADQSTELWRCLTWAVTNGSPGSAGATANNTWAYHELTITFSFRRLAGTGA